jgi:hypothetical protein
VKHGADACEHLMPTLHEHCKPPHLILPQEDPQACGRSTSSIIDGCWIEEKKPNLSHLVVSLHDGGHIDRCAVRLRLPV